MIINKRERKLVKGPGYFMDLMLIGMFGALSGLFGFPWLNGATVRGVTHISALTKTENVGGTFQRSRGCLRTTYDQLSRPHTDL